MLAMTVLVVLAVLWAAILVPPRLRRGRDDVRQTVEREERMRQALGHAAGWDGSDDRTGPTKMLPHVRRVERLGNVDAGS